MIKVIVGVVVAAVVAMVVFMSIDPNIQTASPYSDNENTLTLNGMSVMVEGEVQKTGAYTLTEGALMSDLIDMAGGVTDSADERAYNLSAELEKGKTYYIASLYDSTNVCTLVEIDKVNINDDDIDELIKISGFTTSIASSLISYREENGPFETLEELTEVKGIGNATYKKVRPYCILHS